jgi:hypothetical protein
MFTCALTIQIRPCKIKLGPLRARFGQRRMPDASAQLIRWLGVGTAKAHGEPKCLGSQQSTKGSKDSKPKLTSAKDESHKPAKHIEETARLASSVETAKDPGKVRRTED